MQLGSILKIVSKPALNILKQPRRTHGIKTGDSVLVKRKITSEDVKKFADLTGDHNSIHLRSEKPVVHGAFLNGLVSGVIGTKLPGCGTIVCKQDLWFPYPCYVGEEVVIHVEVVQIRKLIEVKYLVHVVDISGKKIVLRGTAHLKLQSEEPLTSTLKREN